MIITMLQKGLVHSPSNLYLVSLATTDCLTGLLIVLPTVQRIWASGFPLCRLWLPMGLTLYSTSSFHLVAIGIDRYRIITEGVPYLQRRSYQSVGEKLLIIWVFGLWTATPAILDYDHVSLDPSGMTYCIAKRIPYFIVHYYSITFWFPAIFLAKIYTKIYVEIKKRSEMGGRNFMEDRECSLSSTTQGQCKKSFIPHRQN